MAANDVKVVIDGLNFFSDGDPRDLLLGGVNAINLTVVNPLSELTEAIDELSLWLARLAQPDSPWLLVETAGDIELAARTGKAGLIMGWQNVLPIGDQLDRLRLFHRLGVRVMQLTYNDANLFGDGCLERRRGGLSELGRRAVSAMNKIGIAIDLSHCGEEVAVQAADISTKPLLITHANATSVFRQPRNKSDDTIRAVARTGGVIGLSIHGFMNWSGDPAQPPTLDGFVRNVKHVRDLVGADHIGIGTDLSPLGDRSSADFFLKLSKDKFSGTAGAFISAFGNRLDDRYPKEVPSPREFPRILDAMRSSGISSAEIDNIAGLNFLRAFRDIWGS